MLRLFVAVPLPENVRADLAGLCSGVPDARWVAAENMHLTLRFIGEVGRGDADDIHQALSRIHLPAFELVVSGVGCFESGARFTRCGPAWRNTKCSGGCAKRWKPPGPPRHGAGTAQIQGACDPGAVSQGVGKPHRHLYREPQSISFGTLSRRVFHLVSQSPRQPGPALRAAGRVPVGRAPIVKRPFQRGYRRYYRLLCLTYSAQKILRPVPLS